MLSKSLPLAIFTTLAAASPLARRAYPPVSQASAFTLVANVTDPSTDFFNPAVQNWFLAPVHVGAGLNAAVLSSASGATFFVNGTGQDVSRVTTSIALPPLTGSEPAPQGVQFTVSTTTGVDGSAAGDEAYVGLDIGPGTVGAGIQTAERSPVPYAFGAFGGEWMVCQVADPTYGNPQYQVRMALKDVIPPTCVAITLLAQCAELPPLDNAAELDLVVEPVQCYENVASIDWSQYSAL